MNSDPITDGTSPDGLAKLLQMAKQNQLSQSNESEVTDISESLIDLLAVQLPVEDALAQSLPGIIQKIYKELPSLTERSLGQLLLDPATDLSIIKHIKSYTKAQAKAAVSTTEQEAATVAYYASLAHALVYYDTRITRLPFDALLENYNELIKNDWLEPGLMDLFKEAVGECKKQIGQT
jgi:hypothetical protein